MLLCIRTFKRANIHVITNVYLHRRMLMKGILFQEFKKTLTTAPFQIQTNS